MIHPCIIESYLFYCPEFLRFVEGEIFAKKIGFSVLLFFDACDTQVNLLMSQNILFSSFGKTKTLLIVHDYFADILK